MQRAFGIPVLAVILVGCLGEITVGDPKIQVAKLNLAADEDGALRAAECIELRGEAACPGYPNPLGCGRLTVAVMGDANAVGSCELAQPAPGERDRLAVKELGHGMPFACRINFAQHCVQCVDVFGKAAVDACGDDGKVEVFSADGFVPGADEVGPGLAGDDVAGPPPPGAQPPGGGDARCDELALRAFNDKLNELLAAEGLAFSFDPAAVPADGRDARRFFNHPKFLDRGEQLCDEGTGTFGVVDRTECEDDAVDQGRCYCEEDDDRSREPRCRCARMTTVSLLSACAALPPDCDKKGWSLAIWRMYGLATSWLNDSPPSTQGFSKGQAIHTIPTPGDLRCLGSPLVLDLAGDGLALTGPGEGVMFDLTGTGAVRTGWVKANTDDALLALDRDGNGRIDDGSELFGEGPSLAGGVAGDGFAALAALDQLALGGNGNGLVDQGDLLFASLRLWRDDDHDGVGQPIELQPLAAAGIDALPLSSSRSARVDRHGNDLGLRGSFLRADGTVGSMVDVYFIND